MNQDTINDIIFGVLISFSAYHILDLFYIKDINSRLNSMENNLRSIKHEMRKIELNSETINTRNYEIQNNIISLKGEIFKKNKLLNLFNYEDPEPDEDEFENIELD